MGEGWGEGFMNIVPSRLALDKINIQNVLFLSR